MHRLLRESKGYSAISAFASLFGAKSLNVKSASLFGAKNLNVAIFVKIRGKKFECRKSVPRFVAL